MRSNQMVAEEQEKAWQINEYAPYADKAQEIAQLRGAAGKNINAGINTGLATMASWQKGQTNPNAGLDGGGSGGGSGGGTAFMGRALPNAVTPRAAAVMTSLGVQPVLQPQSGINYNILNPVDRKIDWSQITIPKIQ
jgi:hypothetical protein